MGSWRVLVLNKWCRFAPPDKHTPKYKQNVKLNINTTKLKD